MRFDAYAGIDGEAPAAIPRAHRLGVFALVEQPTPGENAQQTAAPLGPGSRR